MQVKDLITKLSNPHWFKVPKDADDMPFIIKPGTEGAFNLYWLMCKMPPVENFTEEFMQNTRPLWAKAYTVSRLIVDGTELECTATILQPGELHSFLVKHGVEKVAKDILSKDS